MHEEAEGASIQVMPVDFVEETKLVFIRLIAATEIPTLFEVSVSTRFVVLIIGPTTRHIKLYEIGRAMASCLADDVYLIKESFYTNEIYKNVRKYRVQFIYIFQNYKVCRESFYSAKSQEDVISIIDGFHNSTLIIPPSEWDPRIRIEPPQEYLSKVMLELYNYKYASMSIIVKSLLKIFKLSSFRRIVPKRMNSKMTFTKT
jgi:hypothetical protein